ncbi:MAG TPA: glycoside hydrolase family 2 protein [Devosiaceae bacterium]
MTDGQLLAGPWLVARLEHPDPAAGDPAKTPGLSWLEARVPGAVQYDLVRHGTLGNPFAGTKAAIAAHWVSESDWVYRTIFDADLGRSNRWALEFDGIDTFAEIWLNGHRLGETRNAYRQYRFDVGAAQLRRTGNELVVLVRNHGAGIADKIPEARRILGHKDGVEGRLGKSLIRRYQRSFFSGSSTLLNVGTGVLGIGIHRPVRLRAVPEVEIVDVFVKTLALTKGAAKLECNATLGNPHGAPCDVAIKIIDPQGTVVAAGAGEADEGFRLELGVANPRLWWPRGYGEPTQYRIEVSVKRDGEVLHTATRRFGIRTVTLLETTPSGRPTFQIVVNDTPVYVRGTNIIPIDYLKVHGEAEAYVRIFALLENGNNNFVRMWGGGAIESEDFYDQCDERGIMVWQDGYLHSMYYPEYDPDFVAEFLTESREMLLKLRRHPALVMLCGGNEQREGWDEWGWKDDLDRFYGETLITKSIPALVEDLSPGVPYVDNSPHGGAWAQSPVYGEGHIWGSHFNSLKDPLFVTETCWGIESYSRPETLKEVMDLDIADFAGKEWVQKWTAHTGRPLINKFPYSGYHNMGGLGPYIRGLELEQALADHYSLANFRLRSPSCHGIAYWSFNKGGPLFQFGSVDYRLRPLMSYYFVARLFRDVVVGLYRDMDDVRLVASNVSPMPVEAEIELLHLRTDGTVLKRLTERRSLPPGQSIRVLDLDRYYDTIIERDREIMFARLRVDGQGVSDDMLLFAPLVEIVTPRSGLEVKAQRIGDDEWELHLATAGFSKLVEIENADGLILEDNYFPLAAGLPRTVRVKALEKRGQLVTLQIGSLDGEMTQAVALP